MTLEEKSSIMIQISWDSRDSFLATARKVKLVAAASRFKSRNDQVSGAALNKAIGEDVDQSFFGIATFFQESLLQDVGMNTLEDYLFNINYSNSLENGDAPSDSYQDSFGEGAHALLFTAQQEYRYIRTKDLQSETKGLDPYQCKLKHIVSFYEAHTALWSKIQQTGSRERQDLIDYAWKHHQMKLGQGIRITSLGWAAVHGVAIEGKWTQKKEDAIKSKMADSILIGHRVHALIQLLGPDVIHLFSSRLSTK